MGMTAKTVEILLADNGFDMDINLLLPKSTMGVTRFNIPIQQTN